MARGHACRIYRRVCHAWPETPPPPPHTHMEGGGVTARGVGRGRYRILERGGGSG